MVIELLLQQAPKIGTKGPGGVGPSQNDVVFQGLLFVTLAINPWFTKVVPKVTGRPLTVTITLPLAFDGNVK